MMKLPDRIDEALLERLARRVTVAGEDRELLDIEAPFTGETFGTLPMGTADDVSEAARQARAAQQSWSKQSFRERARIFLRFHDLIFQRKDEILDLIQMETGKARNHAYEEIGDAAIVARYYAFNARKHLKSRKRKGIYPILTATREQHAPVGLVGFITPWNYPLTLGITDAIAALMAGNGALLKPDRQTPFTALWAVDLLYQAGLPADLLQVVVGKGSVLGQPIIESVDYLAFTGSTGTGRLLAAATGEKLIGCTMELGGKNPMVILDDANLSRAARVAVWDCFSSTGQLCVSIERILIQSTIYDEFVRLFAEETQSLKLGASFDYSADIGSLISAEQLEKVRSHVEDAVMKGAKVAAGGRPRPELGPYFYEPTILENVTEEMALFAEETFGPVVSLYRFESIDEAVEKSNSSTYGLHASIWTRDTARGRRVASGLKAGTVSINDTYRSTWGSIDAPMGGFKDSGLGRRHGAAGIVKYTESQTVTVQRLLQVGPPRGMSEERFHNFLTRGIKLLRRIPGLR